MVAIMWCSCKMSSIQKLQVDPENDLTRNMRSNPKERKRAIFGS